MGQTRSRVQGPSRTLPGRQMANKISRSDLRFRQNLWSKMRFPYTSDSAKNITKDKSFTTKSKRFITKCKTCYAPKPHTIRSCLPLFTARDDVLNMAIDMEHSTRLADQVRGGGGCGGGGCSTSGVRFTSLPPPRSAQTTRLSSAHTAPTSASRPQRPCSRHSLKAWVVFWEALAETRAVWGAGDLG